MAVVRGLLGRGNTKLGEGIHTFSLPAGTTCPGKSPECFRACYARSNRYRYPAVQQRLRWNLSQSRRGDFVKRVCREVVRKGVIVLRLHPSGDLYDKAYAEKWLAIIRACPRVTVYLYTRSWRTPEVLSVLERIAAEPNARVWFSLDAGTGLPERVPLGVRLCYLQTADDQRAENVDLYFRVRSLRRKRVGLPVLPLCPSETPEGRSKEVTCGSCRKCWA
jgi:hypothetical protein